MQYPIGRHLCESCPPDDPDPQAEVLFLVREAITNTTHAITTSERREDFPALITVLLALKYAEETVKR